ncbi:MAG TPA: glutamate--tRNA ligase [Actinomycetota bacterium]|nr:glutamate--tRNA ligase [Actinomycetota bacterium]
MTDVRVRFAPSPTGYLHVGGARTALYNWLHAQRHGGTFVLRVEDTDAARNTTESTDAILASLSWLGLRWDEGPYLQSEARAEHVAVAQRLVDEGRAYYCDCARAEIEERVRDPHATRYDGHCRDRGLAPGTGRVVRFRVPDGRTVVRDLLRGEPAFDHAGIDDFVVLRSDGTPVFVLANAVDDARMRISHVIRGEEHLPTTPKYILLCEAMGAPVPTFAHLPVLVNEKRQKLSKRRDHVAVEYYREQGFLPDALVNYLALLGWSPRDDREILSRDELVAAFDVGSVNLSAAFFDEAKLRHFNGVYIRERAPDRFLDDARPWVDDAARARGWTIDDAVLERVAPLAQTRVALLSEVPDLVEPFFVDDVVVDGAAVEEVLLRPPYARSVLTAALSDYADCDWVAERIKDCTHELGARHDLNLRKTQAPIRVAVTGRKVGLPLFETLEVLGRDRALARITAALERYLSHDEDVTPRATGAR